MNKYIGEGGTLLFILESQLKNAEGMMELEKSPLTNHQNNWFRQESWMDVKSRVFKFEEYCDVYILSEYIPTKYFFMTKGKMVTV